MTTDSAGVLVASNNPLNEPDASLTLELPAGTERVAQFMRYFEIHGNGLDSLGGVRLLPVAPKSSLPVSTKTATIYRVKVPALPAPGTDTPRFKLAVEGQATITRIDLGYALDGSGVALTFGAGQQF